MQLSLNHKLTQASVCLESSAQDGPRPVVDCQLCALDVWRKHLKGMRQARVNMQLDLDVRSDKSLSIYNTLFEEDIEPSDIERLACCVIISGIWVNLQHATNPLFTRIDRWTLLLMLSLLMLT